MGARRKIVVTGMIATYPVGGVFWDDGQYAPGFERLGFFLSAGSIVCEKNKRMLTLFSVVSL
jgi:hypothetical protein